MAAAAPPPGLVGRIGPDDVLEITVLDAPELSRTARVSAQGQISMPLIGVISAYNQTPQQLEQTIAGKLRGKYMVDPQVSVELKEMRARSIFVLGAVRQPGSFPLTGSEQLTVLRALALGGGLTGTAAKGGARIIRHDAAGRRSEIPVDLGKVLAGQAPDVTLHTNDILLVPSSSGKTVAAGMLNAVIRMVTLRGIF
jgi:polysaccharide export outer membrane protein